MLILRSSKHMQIIQWHLMKSLSRDPQWNNAHWSLFSFAWNFIYFIFAHKCRKYNNQYIITVVSQHIICFFFFISHRLSFFFNLLSFRGNKVALNCKTSCFICFLHYRRHNCTCKNYCAQGIVIWKLFKSGVTKQVDI